MTTTDEREQAMTLLRRIAELMPRLESAEPTAREREISAQYPRMPRERVLRIVAKEMAEKEITDNR